MCTLNQGLQPAVHWEIRRAPSLFHPLCTTPHWHSATSFMPISGVNAHSSMAKRKRQTKRGKELFLPCSMPHHNSSVQSKAKSKKCHLSLSPRTASKFQLLQSSPQMETCPPQVNGKLWNQFYEPLVLLLAYRKSQGKHFKINSEFSYGLGSGYNALRTKLLDELAYILGHCK